MESCLVQCIEKASDVKCLVKTSVSELEMLSLPRGPYCKSLKFCSYFLVLSVLFPSKEKYKVMGMTAFVSLLFVCAFRCHIFSVQSHAAEYAGCSVLGTGRDEAT